MNPFPKYLRAKSSNKSQKMKSKTPARQLLREGTTAKTRAKAIAPTTNIAEDPVTIQFARAQTIPIRPASKNSPCICLGWLSPSKGRVLTSICRPFLPPAPFSIFDLFHHEPCTADAPEGQRLFV